MREIEVIGVKRGIEGVRSWDGVNWVEGESKIGWLKVECFGGILCFIFYLFGLGFSFCFE